MVKMMKTSACADKHSRAFRPRALRQGGLFSAALALVLVPTSVFAARGDVLDSLSQGMWTIHDRQSGSTERICVRTGSEFIQLRHRQAGCSRFLVRSSPDEIVVQYTCKGQGYARTSVRRESSELIQIDSQGVKNGTPFAVSGEARRIGRC